MSPATDTIAIRPEELRQVVDNAVNDALSASGQRDMRGRAVMTEGQEHVDKETGIRFKMTKGTQLIRVFRIVNGQPLWLAMLEWKKKHSDKRFQSGPMAGQLIFSPVPPRGKRLSEMANTEECPVCMKGIQQGRRGRYTAHEAHIVYHHPRSDECYAIRDSKDAEPQNRQTKALVDALRELFDVAKLVPKEELVDA
jgi:hypothetical protein